MIYVVKDETYLGYIVPADPSKKTIAVVAVDPYYSHVLAWMVGSITTANEKTRYADESDFTHYQVEIPQNWERRR